MVIPEKTDPIELFDQWFAEAKAAPIEDATAMALATADSQGIPSVRMVLLKAHSSEGFVFYTNLESKKSHDLIANPQASLLFYWIPLEHQVRITGRVERVTAAEADAYYASRPRESRIGAWASKQSQPMEGGWDLEKRVALYTARYAIGKIPRPEFWSGYRVVPEQIEFWVKKPFRLHERLRYTWEQSGWGRDRLYP